MTDLPIEPWPLLADWLDTAIESGQYKEPTAMCLATADASGRPSSRMVLLKEHSPQGIVFYTNYTSRKGQQIDENPYASVTLWWDEHYRQIRLEGPLEKVSEAESDDYFATRPRASNISAMASQQSHPVESREALENRVAELEQEFAGQDVPRPPQWGGFRLRPDRVEFWQGMPNRLHDRQEYLLENDSWVMRRIQP